MPLRMDSLAWLAGAFSNFDNVAAATPVPPVGLSLQINEKPAVLSLILHEKRITRAIVEKYLNEDHEFVMNIPKAGVWDGTAIEYCQTLGLGWGGMGDLVVAARDEQLSLQPKEYRWATDMLRKHGNTLSVNRLMDRLFEVERANGPTLRVALVKTYDLTADEVRTAYDDYGPFSVLFDNNPNGRPTVEALEAAASLGITSGKAKAVARRLHEPH